jgi:hypothetical protein
VKNIFHAASVDACVIKPTNRKQHEMDNEGIDWHAATADRLVN